MSEQTKTTVVQVALCPSCESIISERGIQMSEQEVQKLLTENDHNTFFLASESSGAKYRWITGGKKCRAC